MLDRRLHRAVAAAGLVIAVFGLAGCNAGHRATIDAGATPDPSSNGGQAIPVPDIGVSAGKSAHLPLVAAVVPFPQEGPTPVSRPDFGDRIKLTAAGVAQPAARTPTDDGRDDPEPKLVGSLAVEKAATRLEQRQQARGYGPAVIEVDGGVRSLAVVDTSARSSGTHAPASKAIRAANRSQPSRWSATYPHVRTQCFGPVLRSALNRIAAHFNAHVSVTSGHRTRGRRRSMHRFCRAADIRVAGVRPSIVARFARSLPGINGVGTYRRKSITHIDTRLQQMVWRY